MEVNMAHFRQKTVIGGFIDFAIFDAKSESGTESDNLELLNSLTRAAIQSKNLKIDQAALVFKKNDQVRFYGSNDLVNYLSKAGFPKWTHTLEVEDP
ncbi:MAG: hypothetical protein COA71_07950 [SAR86 cluster bacterium]|uniref:Uncharacterized protein n=1 Tax=SAR86 cluster bacterium TaxID=2030880 RepID=A0A2A5CCG6_9GAMM|nr:MAG: hypothetical protein COA71_07950 [SAR86 cluster bacterium]